ncbi:MAG: ABC transporter permease [Ruminococcus sp.]|nr:ABC transporter permease [Ruminococcus sp.]
MNKFLSLLKKELREMLTAQTIGMLIFMLIMMYSMGGLMTRSSEEAQEQSGRITICDLDKTEFSESVVEFLKQPTADMTNDVTVFELESDDYAAELNKLGVKSFVVLNKGFTDKIMSGEQAEIIYVSRMTSLATMSNMNVGSETAVQLISAAVKTALYTQKVNEGALTEKDALLLEAPVGVTEHTIVNDKSEGVSQLLLYSSLYSRSLFMPLVVYIMVLLGSQTMINAVSAEKIDKTLETLLSAPVSRLHIICAKMLAAAVIALLNAAVYMFGMNNLTIDLTGDLPDDMGEKLRNLGLVFDLKTYMLIGAQMLLTMLIALSLAMILGAFAKDIKSSQTLLLPLMFVTIIPFMASMFTDISGLPGTFKYLLYAIPFTHTFNATDCVLFGKTNEYVFGLIYQIVFLIVCLAITVKIFTSDTIFTMTEHGAGLFKKKKAQTED